MLLFLIMLLPIRNRLIMLRNTHLRVMKKKEEEIRERMRQTRQRKNKGKERGQERCLLLILTVHHAGTCTCTGFMGEASPPNFPGSPPNLPPNVACCEPYIVLNCISGDLKFKIFWVEPPDPHQSPFPNLNFPPNKYSQIEPCLAIIFQSEISL